MPRRFALTFLLAVLAAGPWLHGQTTPAASTPPPAPAVDPGPVGPSPYDIVRGWHKPFAAPGFAFGGNSGVFAESPDRILIAQRGEFRLPSPVPPSTRDSPAPSR